MDLENFLNNIEFANRSEKTDKQLVEKMDNLATSLTERGERVNPIVIEYFKDPDLFDSLPEAIRNDEHRLSEFVVAMSKFGDMINLERQKRWDGDTDGLFGEEIKVEGAFHFNGNIRIADPGYKLNIGYLRTVGIDPSKVLFFRITQPVGDTDKQKPEYFWTSDYYETKRGLSYEIPPEQRETAIILVASLDVINSNGGLMQDINDDNGLSVRQIGVGEFDQNLALAKIKPSRLD